MTTIPEPINTIAAAIDDWHTARQDKPRPHMGASGLGHPCDRWVWLSFRWAVIEQFDGRILRLFRRGQNEEATVVADLKAIGCRITHTGVNQSRVDLGGHLGGSIDGIIESGLPGAEGTRHVLEIKTHGRKSFDALVKVQSVQQAKPVHWCQMQLYMHGEGIHRALYAAVCKDTDRYYFERVRYDEKAAQALIERGQRISTADRMPEPISADPSWYQCRFCPAHEFCHSSHKTREVNCRTCAHSTAQEDGQWHCARWNAIIPLDAQRTGCPSHVLHPDLVPWQMKASDDEHTAVYEINGQDVRNGKGPDAYESGELLANPDACTSGDDVIARLRVNMGGRVIG